MKAAASPAPQCAAAVQKRSILKNHNVSNLLKMANDKMLRELEQCVEERDRLNASIEAAPTAVCLSMQSPRTRAAQSVYREDMIDHRRQISELIEEKYSLLRETLKEGDIPPWLAGKDNSAEFTLVDYKKAKPFKLFRRQSSILFFQQGEKKRSSCGADPVTSHEQARKVERLQLTRRDSEAQLGGNSNDLLSRLSKRLAIS